MDSQVARGPGAKFPTARGKPSALSLASKRMPTINIPYWFVSIAKKKLLLAAISAPSLCQPPP